MTCHRLINVSFSYVQYSVIIDENIPKVRYRYPSSLFGCWLGVVIVVTHKKYDSPQVQCSSPMHIPALPCSFFFFSVERFSSVPISFFLFSTEHFSFLLRAVLSGEQFFFAAEYISYLHIRSIFFSAKHFSSLMSTFLPCRAIFFSAYLLLRQQRSVDGRAGKCLAEK